MSHSKRNTSLAFFTSYERSLLKTSWGSQSTRLTRDSFLPFGSCRLCLLPARDPVACPGSAKSKADIFCRECALNDLVAQRKEIKRLEREWEEKKSEREDEELRRRDDEAADELEQFERTAQGLSENAFGGKNRKRKATELHASSSTSNGPATKQRKGDDAESSFWVPGVDISSKKGDSAADARPAKLHPMCPASTPSTKHNYALKSLVTVHFTEDNLGKDSSKADGPARICPSCKKVLSNSSKAVLAKPCGHVLCGSCADQFMKPPDKVDPHDPDGKAKVGKVLCYECGIDLTEGKGVKEGKEKDKIKPGLVEISCEGTGFAGGGSNLAKKEGVAFQC